MHRKSAWGVSFSYKSSHLSELVHHPQLNQPRTRPTLACSDDSAFNVDEWVLNTEAHPLRISQPQGTAAAEQQQQQRKKWWWPPGKSRVTVDGNDGDAGVAQQR